MIVWRSRPACLCVGVVSLLVISSLPMHTGASADRKMMLAKAKSRAVVSKVTDMQRAAIVPSTTSDILTKGSPNGVMVVIAATRTTRPGMPEAISCILAAV